MNRFRQITSHALYSYLLALILMAAAIGLRWVMAPVFGDGFRLIFLYGAIAFSVWHSGWRPALLITIVGYALSNYFFMGEPGQLHFSVESDVGFIAYLFSCSIFIFFGEMSRRANDRLKGAEEMRSRLAAIVSASDDAILSKSLDGTIRSWNTGAERLLGYTKEEIIGKPTSTIIPPELFGEEDDIIKRISQGERVPHFDSARLSKDGRRIELSITVSPVFDDKGKVVGASTVARDITDRKQAERHFRLMADAAPVLISTADTEKRTNWVNKQWREFTGRDLEAELGNGWTDNLHPDDFDTCLKTFSENFNARRPYSVEYRLKRHDGQYRWMLDKSLPLYGRGNQFIGYIGCCTDITDLKQAEEALQQADQRKDEFLATLAHELRNPLAPISHSLELLRYAQAKPELLDKARTSIERQLNHLVRLVDDLLNVSRISRDKLTLRKEQTALASVVEQAVETARPLLDECSHALDVKLPEQPVYLDADAVRLAQVLSNLLNNACKYTAHGGRIAVTAEQQDNQVCIKIKDNGMGIARDQLNSIFDMFGQLDTTLDHAIGGLGIGLTLAKRLVEMHGGRITAHSQGPGHGSEFRVYLPILAQLVPEKPAPASVKQQTAAAQRILVVDDNLDSADTLATVLRIGGHEVKTVHDGLAAIEAAEAFQPDLMLLDIGLPKLDGYGACREIRKHAWGKSLTIVALTGWGQEDDRRKSREAGFDTHLVKPVNYEALTELLNGTPKASVGGINAG